MNNWYYYQNDAQQGPVNEAQLQALLASGTINPTDLGWKEGMDNWLPFNQIVELNDIVVNSLGGVSVTPIKESSLPEEQATPVGPGFSLQGAKNPYAEEGTAKKMTLLDIIWSFHGRITVGQFWIGVGLIAAIVVGFIIFMSTTFAPIFMTGGFVLSLPVVLMVFVFPIFYGTFVLAVITKRLHDRNQSGLFGFLILSALVIIKFSVFIGVFNGVEFSENTLLIIDIVRLSLVLWLLVKCCLPGTLGSNRYGKPQPRAGEIAP